MVQFKHFQQHRHHTFVAANALIRIVYQLFILNLLSTILPRLYNVDTSGKANWHCASAGPLFNSQVVEIWDISRSGAIFSRQSVPAPLIDRLALFDRQEQGHAHVGGDSE